MDKKMLIDELNADLAGELGAIIQYTIYAAKASGPFRPQLVQFFSAEIPDEQGHAQFLANKIVALGGEPTTQPRPVPAARSNREMLEAVLAAEQQATRDYACRAEQAAECENWLGAIHLARQKFSEAEGLMIPGADRYLTRSVYFSPQEQRDSIKHLVQLFTALNKPDQAANWQRRLDPAGASSAIEKPKPLTSPTRSSG